jgi:hypothetical protein
VTAPIIEEVDVDDLLLDPLNPRLRRAPGDPLLGPDQLLRAMVAWELDELIVSFTQSGFWKHEPLIVVDIAEPGCSGSVVVEGNRRLAALKCLRARLRGEPVPSRRITRICDEALAAKPDIVEQSEIFTKVPIVKYEKRKQVDAYLGFRHVTGVKQWQPQEKATFIVHLIDQREYSYSETAKLIGSTPEYVRRNYIGYHLLNKFEEEIESDAASQALERARDDFSVFFLSLREEGVRSFLNVSLDHDPEQIQNVVSAINKENAERFLIWMFGSDEQESFIGESRNVKKFAEILSTPEALEYVVERKSPNFEIAYGLTRGAADDVVAALKQARELLRNVLADLDLSENEVQIAEAAWPVISASVEIAKRVGGETLAKMKAAVDDAHDA